MEEPINFFYHHICHICKLKLPTIKTCSGCRLVSYCSQMHQKEDWKYHKSLCLCVRNFLKKHNLKGLFVTLTENFIEWRKTTLSLTCAVELVLNRPLMAYEKQMFFFPDVCPVCFIANFDRYHTCQRCHCVTYCSEEHKRLHFRKHETDCLPFKICYEVDKICYESQLSKVNFDLPQGDIVFSDSMEDFLNNNFTNSPDFSKTLLSEHFSGALSILFAISASQSICKKNELTIHIIGASNYEQSVLMTIEILFHRFSHLRKLNLTLIGPELSDNYLEPVLCGKCDNIRKLIVHKEKKLYHQYNKHRTYMNPDLIISYNCGFSEVINSNNNPWQESIVDIWNLKQVLFAFTSYTKSEAKADFSLVLGNKPETKGGLKLLMNSFPNPFKSLRPYRNWECFDCTFFYNNHFIGMIEV